MLLSTRYIVKIILSNMSQRRSNRSQVEGDDPSLEEPITKCVQYILSRESSKIPLKRAEILKVLCTSCETPSNKVNSVIVGANRKLKQVYGYKLVQVEAKSGIQYIVVLDQSCDSSPSELIDPHHRRLLTAALTHIFMSGGPVKDDEMWKFLAEAGLLEENDHAGRKILTNTFTKQLYLTYTKVGEGELARNVFEWGQRATEEWPKQDVLQKMAGAFDKDMTHWSEQYKEAMGDRQVEVVE